MLCRLHVFEYSYFRTSPFLLVLEIAWRIISLPPLPRILRHPHPTRTNHQRHHGQAHAKIQSTSIAPDYLTLVASATQMHFHNPSESQSNARRIKLQRANQASRDPLLISLDAVACDDGGGSEDEVWAKGLKDCGWKN